MSTHKAIHICNSFLAQAQNCKRVCFCQRYKQNGKEESQQRTMYIVYGGRSAKYERFNNKNHWCKLKDLCFKTAKTIYLTLCTRLKNKRNYANT